MITVIGLDGGPLGEQAAARLAAASLVVGAARHLAAVPLPERARRITAGGLTETLTALDAHLPGDRPAGDPAYALGAPAAGTADGDRAVVLAGGDPGFFGVVRALREHRHGVEVLPARSAVGLAFARAGLSWDDAVVVSASAGGLRRVLNVCRAHRKVAVLTAPGAGPGEIARGLAPSTPRTLVVCERLGGPGERVVWSRLGEATTRSWRDPDVVIVLAERRPAAEPVWLAGAGPGPGEWALAEEAFGHRTRLGAEARAFVLARLGPRLGDLVWDVGAGSGAVAVECARLGAAVVAVERDAAECERIRRNVRAHGVKVMLSRGEAPAALEPLPDPDAVFVGGGGAAVVAAAAARRPRAIVAALRRAEGVPPVLEALRAGGYPAEGVRLQASRLRPAPDGGLRFPGAAPLFLVWGTAP